MNSIRQDISISSQSGDTTRPRAENRINESLPDIERLTGMAVAPEIPKFSCYADAMDFAKKFPSLAPVVLGRSSVSTTSKSPPSQTQFPSSIGVPTAQVTNLSGTTLAALNPPQIMSNNVTSESLDDPRGASRRGEQIPRRNRNETIVREISRKVHNGARSDIAEPPLILSNAPPPCIPGWCCINGPTNNYQRYDFPIQGEILPMNSTLDNSSSDLRDGVDGWLTSVINPLASNSDIFIAPRLHRTPLNRHDTIIAPAHISQPLSGLHNHHIDVEQNSTRPCSAPIHQGNCGIPSSDPFVKPAWQTISAASPKVSTRSGDYFGSSAILSPDCSMIEVDGSVSDTLSDASSSNPSVGPHSRSSSKSNTWPAMSREAATSNWRKTSPNLSSTTSNILKYVPPPARALREAAAASSQVTCGENLVLQSNKSQAQAQTKDSNTSPINHSKDRLPNPVASNKLEQTLNAPTTFPPIVTNSLALSPQQNTNTEQWATLDEVASANRHTPLPGISGGMTSEAPRSAPTNDIPSMTVPVAGRTMTLEQAMQAVRSGYSSNLASIW